MVRATSTDTGIEISVRRDKVVVPVRVQGLLTDPLTILLLRKSLEGIDSAVKLPSLSTSLKFPLKLPGGRYGLIGGRLYTENRMITDTAA